MSALQPAFPEPTGSAPEGAQTPPNPSARKSARRRTSVAWPAPAPQAVPPGARRAAPVVVPEPETHPTTAPPAAGPFPRFVAPQPAPPTPPSAPAVPAFAHRFQPPTPARPAPVPPTPVSVAGADLPAALAPAPAPAVPALPDEPLAARLAQPAPPKAPRAPQPPAQPAPRSPGERSSAPPGFHAQRLVIAESAELLALDPSLDDETPQAIDATAPAAPRPAPSALRAVPAPLPELTPEQAASLAGPLTVTLPGATPAANPDAAKEIGGSRIAALIAGALPRRGDRAQFGRDRGATARLAAALIVVSVLVVVAGPLVANLLRPLPIVGPAVEGLESLALYPRVYGVEWLTATLGIISVAGVAFAQMEKSAVRQNMRRDPVRRLNIALTSVLALAMGAGAMSTLHSHGWAAAAADTVFFGALCLLVPLSRMPGARAMGPQPERAWALLFLLSIPAVVIAPSVPTLAIAVLAFTHVRTNWTQVLENDDAFADGPIDRTNRRAALIITVAVLLASSVGLHAMAQSPDELRGLQTQEHTNFPGAEEGPAIGEPTP